MDPNSPKATSAPSNLNCAIDLSQFVNMDFWPLIDLHEKTKMSFGLTQVQMKFRDLINLHWESVTFKFQTSVLRACILGTFQV